MRVAIIPARGGSTRIPRKNIRLFHGKPIIAYSIETALESKLFDGNVWVSTEDQEIMEVARRYGAMVLVRSEKYAANDVGTQEVMADALQTLILDADQPIDVACCIYATAPLMSVRDLALGCGVLERNPKAAYAFSVGGEHPTDAGQFYWGHAISFLQGIPLDIYADNVWKIMIDRERFCDINTEDDWQRAEQMYQALRQPA